MTITYELFGAAYGQSIYGNDIYSATASSSNDGSSSSGTGATTGTDGGTLPATGTNIMFGFAGGILLILVALVLFVTSRRKRNAAKAE